MSVKNFKAMLKDVRKIEFIREVLTPEDDEMLVKVLSIGVCSSDCKNYKHNNSIYFGHEILGEIITQYEDYQIGDKVVVFYKYPCGNCPKCMDGNEHLCMNPGYLDKGFSQYIKIKKKVSGRCLFRVPNDYPLEEGALTDSLACVLQGVKSLNLQDNDERILLLGNGFVAILFTLILKEMGKEVSMYGRNADKFYKIASTEADVDLYTDIAQIKTTFNACIDTTGSVDVINHAVRKVKSRGKILCYSRISDSKNALDINTLRESEIDLCFSRFTTKECISKAIDMISQGKASFRKFLTIFKGIDRLEEAIVKTLDSNIIRGVILTND